MFLCPKCYDRYISRGGVYTLSCTRPRRRCESCTKDVICFKWIVVNRAVRVVRRKPGRPRLVSQ
jgi:hypothetical protein